MKEKIIYICFSLLLCISVLDTTHAAINFTVTPIRYEIDINPWESITQTASIRNNGNTTVTLPTTSSDFEARDVSGTPRIVRKSELVNPDQQLSTWITLSESSVTLNPWEEKTIEFTINVPEDATPGWHYGAVLFQNNNSESSSDGNIAINVDYGVILLVEVSGEIDIDIDIETPKIQNKIWYWYWSFWPDSPVWNLPLSQAPWEDGWFLWEDEDGNPLYQQVDICPLWDISGGKYDGRCFPWEPKLFEQIEPLLFADNFEVEFSLPVSNNGNTHVRPTGKITLRDEDGNIIPWIGKETIANEFGAVIWENVVDYIPINDEQWNVLPNSRRIYNVYWKWFPYQSYDERWNIIIKYWTPSEYYTRLWQRESGYLMPWEIISQERTRKNITADIELRYPDIDGNEVVFNSAQEFPIQYIREKIIINPYVIIWIILLWAAALMIFFSIRWWVVVVKVKKCWNCREKIKSHWWTCPHCQALQNKKKHKALQKMGEEKWKKK